jgi:predicted transcriptional regulator
MKMVRVTYCVSSDVSRGVAEMARREDRSASWLAGQLLAAGLARATEERRRTNLSEFARVAELDVAPLAPPTGAASTTPDDTCEESV